MPRLSILICSLEGRGKMLERLLGFFKAQVYFAFGSSDAEEVEILYLVDNGEKTTGEKRNILLDSAKGDYVAFFDDDDLPGPTYVTSILRALSENPDCVNLNMIMITDGVKAERSFHSLQFKQWVTYNDPIEEGKFLYVRNPHHLCPVRREIAQQVRFPHISMGEDKDYSDRLLPFLKTEATVEEPIYFYLFNSKK